MKFIFIFRGRNDTFGATLLTNEAVQVSEGVDGANFANIVQYCAMLETMVLKIKRKFVLELDVNISRTYARVTTFSQASVYHVLDQLTEDRLIGIDKLDSTLFMRCKACSLSLQRTWSFGCCRYMRCMKIYDLLL